MIIQIPSDVRHGKCDKPILRKRVKLSMYSVPSIVLSIFAFEIIVSIQELKASRTKRGTSERGYRFEAKECQ